MRAQQLQTTLISITFIIIIVLTVTLEPVLTGTDNNHTRTCPDWH